MSGSGPVVCAACGARMKADRRMCLRCGDVLLDTATAAASHAPRHLSQRRTIIVSVVASAVVLGLAGVLWRTSDAAASASAPLNAGALTTTRTAAPARRERQAESAPTTYEAVTFLDATRGGGAAFVSGDFESARAGYENALTKRPDDPDALNGLGQALVRLGRVEEGIARFERAVQVAPDAWAPHFNLAAAAGQRGQWDRAVDQYREAVRVFGDDYATQFNLALALHKNGDETAAIAEYEKAIRLAPGEPSFHVALGVSLEKSGRVEDAIREYRASLEMDPASADAESLKTHVAALTQALHTERGSTLK